MRPGVDKTDATTRGPRPPRALSLSVTLLVVAAVTIGGYLAMQMGSDPTDDTLASGPGVGGTAETTATTSSSGQAFAPNTTIPQSEGTPELGEPYVVSPTEAEPAAKQVAVDIAYSLTTYEASADHEERLDALESLSGAGSLTQAAAPLIFPDSWSRGEVIYPQMGGLSDGRASVMVVTRQTVGSGSETELSIVRTLDIRLALGESGWEFDSLASAGGTFHDLDELTVADAVADDPRITMPDSARLDILEGRISPTLLVVMSELADQTPYEVVVLATGHPHNVFETDRLSHHTIGQAVDISRIGDRHVIDDRGPGSESRAIAEWLYARPDVLQVGGPWDLDGEESTRSFTNPVHQDHIHVAVDD